MEENSENSDKIYIGELKSVNDLDAKETNCVWYGKVLVNKNAVMFKLDTGSQVNVIPKSELLKWDEKPVIRNCKITVLDYGDNRVPILGECYLNCETKRFLVLPFGLNYAPEEFQRAMDEIYEDDDINPYFDDIALGSSTVEEHCRILRRTLLKARKANLKFNVLKTQLSQTSVNYLGKNLVIADALSRAQSTTDNFDEVLGQEATMRINLLTQASPIKWEEIASLTAGDPEMQDVLFHINNGWPQKKKTKIAAQSYWHCKEELYSKKKKKELFAEDND
ncbi:retrovirus-related Pol polyprotein from transposon 17.6 [Trichonephila clavipes]|nr:retrovirus-related Pol polyprotein from transposon 17.6 [Trichonephila clavipes]